MKYVDGSGKQVMEIVGAERDGWTERRAREALADRLSDVRRRVAEALEARMLGAVESSTHLGEPQRISADEGRAAMREPGLTDRLRTKWNQ